MAKAFNGIVYNGVKLPALGTRAWQRLVVIGAAKAPAARTEKEKAALAFELDLAARDAADAAPEASNPFVREMQAAGTAEPHCEDHKQFEYDCIDCADALAPATEPGAAAITITLRNGDLMVRHGDDGAILGYGKNVPPGTWKQLWQALEALGIEPTPAAKEGGK